MTCRDCEGLSVQVDNLLAAVGELTEERDREEARAEDAEQELEDLRETIADDIGARIR